MLNFLTTYSYYLKIGLALVVSSYIVYLHIVISGLEDDLIVIEDEKKKIQLKLIVSEVNTQTIQNALTVVQQKNKQNTLDDKKKYNEFIANTKPKVVTKYINKYIKGVASDKTECENINSILDSL